MGIYQVPKKATFKDDDHDKDFEKKRFQKHSLP
jgi:hypothetical protein